LRSYSTIVIPGRYSHSYVVEPSHRYHSDRRSHQHRKIYRHHDNRRFHHRRSYGGW
jgi:hypothetical protein